jgi:uncharacterized protein (DUF1501 family)
MAISRRTLLGTGLAGTLGAILPVPGVRNLAFAESSTVRPILVVVHLRGGCDGLNLVSPANDPIFIEARASDLRVAADGADAGFRSRTGRTRRSISACMPRLPASPTSTRAGSWHSFMPSV